MKTGVEHHQVQQKVNSDIGASKLVGLGHIDFLAHGRDCPQHENANDCNAKVPDRSAVSGHEDIVEHRLDEPAQRPEHRPFKRHEEHGRRNGPEMLAHIAAPEPTQKRPGRGIVRWYLAVFGHAG